MKQFLILTLFLGFSVFSNAQTADEIINKHIEAIGGKAAWDKINSLYAEISMNQGIEIPAKIWTVNEKAFRVEFTVQGMTGIQVVTDKDGWGLMPFMGQTKPEPTPTEQVKAGQSQLDLKGELIDYKAKGSTVEAIGEEDVEGVETYKIKVTDKDKTETTYYIDKETYYIVKSESKVMLQGQEQMSATVYGDYKKVGDVIMAYSMQGGGMGGTMTVKKYEINPTVDMSIFEMPK
jgi:hypothetical protein